jgi:hypothetical protein
MLSPVYRITVYVPPADLDRVLARALEQTDLRFGNYEHVAHWTRPGVEQFRPLPGSAPAVGSVDHVSRVDTVLLDLVIPRDRELLDRLVDAILAEHPWDEPVVIVDESVASASHLTPET